MVPEESKTADPAVGRLWLFAPDVPSPRNETPPPVVPASDDVEAELARLSALIGVANGLLAAKDSMLELAAADVRGYGIAPDGSVTVTFRRHNELVDRLTADFRLFDTADAAIEQLVPAAAPASSVPGLALTGTAAVSRGCVVCGNSKQAHQVEADGADLGSFAASLCGCYRAPFWWRRRAVR